MTQPVFRRLALATAALAAAYLPATAGAVEINDVFDFHGTATDIGVQRGPGQIGGIEYRIDGKFDYDGPIDLHKAKMTFQYLLDEYLPGGNGEFVLTTDNADLVCPDPPDGCVPAMPPLIGTGSKSTEGKYESPARFRPQVRVQIKRKGNEFQFNVRLDRGLSPQTPPLPLDRQFPKLCGIDPLDKSKRLKTEIRTGFTLDDGVHEPIVVEFVKDWECSQPGRYHLRSR